MTGFTLLEHTSEIGFEATGETIEEAFANAGKAMFEIMTDIDTLQCEQNIDFTVESENLDALLFDFADELIFISQAEGLLLCTFDISITKKDGGFLLTCNSQGQKVGEQTRLQEIKAPTYSDMIVEQQGAGWRLQMFVDV